MKGVEAPFQLVVSVIAMLMVLVLAYTVLANATKEDCNRKWEIELGKFSSALSTAIHGSAPTKVSNTFDFRCGNATRYTLYLRTASSSTCLRVCGSSEGSGCAFFELRAEEVRGSESEVVGDVFSCVEGASKYLDLTSDGCPSGFENVVDELQNNGVELSRPFGRFIVKRILETGEPIAICLGG